MNLTPTTLVSDIVAEYPASAKVFERNGIDFCCGGRRPVGDACAEGSVGFDQLRAEIEAAVGSGSAGRNWAQAPLADLVDHILERYHAKLRQDLPGLTRMSGKVTSVHGERHPEVKQVEEVFAGLRAELESHMRKEEMVLFPLIRGLDSGESAGQPMLRMLEHPIRVMEHEHDGAGEALRNLRRLSNGYAPPGDACETFRALYRGLEELERDLHEHIHLENNALFPRALEARNHLARV
jgi:regulator of cell morphogenesis and NO signaling